MPEVTVQRHYRRSEQEIKQQHYDELEQRINVVTFREIAPPEWLQGEALTEWHRVIDIMRSANMLTAVDATLLAMYCHTYARWKEIDDTLRSEGLTVAAASNPNIFKANPLLKVQQALMRDILSLSKHFGFSPWTRQHIRLPKQETKDEKSTENSLDQF